jgi:hypothetical protein
VRVINNLSVPRGVSRLLDKLSGQPSRPRQTPEFGTRLLGRVEESQARRRVRVQLILTVSILAANLIGIAAGLLEVAVAFPVPSIFTDAPMWLTFVVAPAYVLSALAVGTVWMKACGYSVRAYPFWALCCSRCFHGHGKPGAGGGTWDGDVFRSPGHAHRVVTAITQAPVRSQETAVRQQKGMVGRPCRSRLPRRRAQVEPGNGAENPRFQSGSAWLYIGDQYPHPSASTPARSVHFGSETKR